jgi:hypothetical protein
LRWLGTTLGTGPSTDFNQSSSASKGTTGLLLLQRVDEPYDLDFGDEPGAKAFVLRGVNDFFTVSITNIVGTSPLLNFWCEWTEE